MIIATILLLSLVCLPFFDKLSPGATLFVAVILGAIAVLAAGLLQIVGVA